MPQGWSDAWHLWRVIVPRRSIAGRLQARDLRLSRVSRLIHKLTYRRHNHDNIHVRGFRDEGTTTTPFDMVVLNNLDRYQLALDAIRRIPRLGDQVKNATERYWTSMERHKLYISENGDDLPEVRDWRWSAMP